MLSFYSAYKVRYTSYNDFDGASLFLFILFICVLTDLGGYFFGKILKGPKLTKISPKKQYLVLLVVFITTTNFLFII